MLYFFNLSKSLLLLEVKLESADFCDQLLIFGGKSYKIENPGTMERWNVDGGDVGGFTWSTSIP